MTSEQARRLYLIVRAAQSHGFEIPTGHDLAAIFYPGKKIGMSQVRAANAIVDRFKRLGCIRLQGKRRHLDASRLATEGNSALYLLKFRDACLATPEVTINSETFHRMLLRDSGNEFNASLLDILKVHAIRSGYVMTVESSPGALRIGRNLSEHLPYLEMLARDRRAGPAHETEPDK